MCTLYIWMWKANTEQLFTKLTMHMNLMLNSLRNFSSLFILFTGSKSNEIYWYLNVLIWMAKSNRYIRLIFNTQLFNFKILFWRICASTRIYPIAYSLQNGIIWISSVFFIHAKKETCATESVGYSHFYVLGILNDTWNEFFDSK